MSNKTFDPETASYEELAAAAGEGTQTEPESGDEPQQVFERVIDLGDGSGAQIFRGNSLEELVDNLAKAQENATRKIREFSQQKPQPQVQQVAEPVIDPNEEFVLSQEFLASPTKAFAKLFQKNTGMTIAEFKTEQARIAGLATEQSEFNIGREFALSHPDYNSQSTKNNDRLVKWLRVENLPVSIENLEKAYADLSESGLLEPKSEQDVSMKTNAAPTTQRAPQPRIAATETRVVGQRRAASGLSQRGSTSTPRSMEPTEDELYEMPIEKLRSLALAEAAARRE